MTCIVFLLVFSQAFAFRTADCARCHGSISAEWRMSSHAGSYSDQLFRNEQIKRNAVGKSSCSCHAPDIYMPSGMGMIPGQRADSLEFGVDCLSCHMDKEMTAYSADCETTVPHFVKTAEGMDTGAACAGCHSWVEDKSSPCQDCHMPDVDGPVSDAPINDRSVSDTHRSHEFLGIGNREFLSGAVDMTVEKADKNYRIKVTSMVSFHRVPQSEFRTLALVAMDSNGNEKKELFALAPDDSYEMTALNNIKKVELRLYPAYESQPANWIVITGRDLE